MTWLRSSRTRRTALLLVLALGAALRLWGVGWGLHGADVSRRPHPDEWVVYWLFQWFGSTRSLNPCPNANGSCFFDWGTVFPYCAYAVRAILTPVFALLPADLFGQHADLSFTRAATAGRLTSVIFSTATVAVAYRFGMRAYSQSAGLLAALLVALSALLVQLAHFATPDSTAGFFAVCALLFALRALCGQTRDLILAGALVGLAGGTEYHLFLLAAPLTCAWWLMDHRSWKSLFLAYGAALVTFLITNFYIILDLPAFVAAGEHTLRIRTVESSVQYGDRWAGFGPAYLYVVHYALGYGVGALLDAWMVVAAVWAAVRRRHADYILLAWTVPYFVLVTISPAKFMRYSAPLVVPLAILAARFAIDVAAQRRIGVRAVCLVLAAVIIFYTFCYDAAYAGLFSSPEPRYATASWVEAHAKPGETVGYQVLPSGLLNMPYFLSARSHPACFALFNVHRLKSMAFVLLDSYTHDEHPYNPTAQVVAFRRFVTHDPRFRLVRRFHYVPTFAGLDFPIDASPHDWRYPAHDISIYARQGSSTAQSPHCFSSLARAAAVLSPKPVTGT